MSGSRFLNPHWSIYDPNIRCYRSHRTSEARDLARRLAENRAAARERSIAKRGEL